MSEPEDKPATILRLPPSAIVSIKLEVEFENGERWQIEKIAQLKPPEAPATTD